MSGVDIAYMGLGFILGMETAAYFFPRTMWPKWDRRRRMDGVRRQLNGRRLGDEK